MKNKLLIATSIALIFGSHAAAEGMKQGQSGDAGKSSSMAAQKPDADQRMKPMDSAQAGTTGAAAAGQKNTDSARTGSGVTGQSNTDSARTGSGVTGQGSTDSARTGQGTTGGAQTDSARAGSNGMQGSDLELARNMSPEQIKNVQQTLKEKGFDTGKVDGVWGESTRGALRAFQRQQDLTPTGTLDRRTLIALEIDGESTGGMNRPGSNAGTGTGMNQMQDKEQTPGLRNDPARTQ